MSMTSGMRNLMMTRELASSNSVALVAASIVGILGLIGVAIGAYVSWHVSKRENSGTIATSKAADLWEEGAAIRTDLRSEIIGLRSQLTEASLRIRDLVEQIGAANMLAREAREDARLLKIETIQLRADVAAVHVEVKTGNALTMGQLADYDESRRIKLIPPAERTEAENEHVDSVGVDEKSDPSVEHD